LEACHKKSFTSLEQSLVSLATTEDFGERESEKENQPTNQPPPPPPPPPPQLPVSMQGEGPQRLATFPPSLPPPSDPYSAERIFTPPPHFCESSASSSMKRRREEPPCRANIAPSRKKPLLVDEEKNEQEPPHQHSEKDNNFVPGAIREADSTEEKVECCICLEEIGVQMGCLTCCEHKFCFDCILQWSGKSNTCPLCKQRFREIIKKMVSCHCAPLDY